MQEANSKEQTEVKTREKARASTWQGGKSGSRSKGFWIGRPLLQFPLKNSADYEYKTELN